VKLFIDSAKINEIREAYSWGIIDGITTNPSLMKKALEGKNKKGKKISLESYIKDILKIAGKTPVSLEVTSTSYEDMVHEGKILFKKFHKFGNVYIKIPVNPCMELKCNNSFDGIRAIRTLSKEKIPINCTLVFTPEQALLAAKAGAKFISPFAGREDDFIREKQHIKFKKTDYFKGTKKGDKGILSGEDLIKKCVEILKGKKAEVLAASIRNPRQLRGVARAGAHIATLPFSVLKESISHYKTLEGMRNFIKDTPKEYKKISLRNKK
tara:strand:- start:509 stop:1312 length:804 start_codon:yes stop_codon:yes gene_type:complete